MVVDLQKRCSENDPLRHGVNLTFEGDDSLLRLLLITSHKNRLANDIIIVA